jgi:hypothetical protein
MNSTTTVQNIAIFGVSEIILTTAVCLLLLFIVFVAIKSKQTKKGYTKAFRSESEQIFGSEIGIPPDL